MCVCVGGGVQCAVRKFTTEGTLAIDVQMWVSQFSSRMCTLRSYPCPNTHTQWRARVLKNTEHMKNGRKKQLRGKGEN